MFFVLWLIGIATISFSCYKLDFFILRLSFIGWLILGQLALYVGVLWVYPYIFCTEANFYAWRIANDDAYPDTPAAPAENDFSRAYGTAPADTAPETDVNTPFSEPADEAEEIPAEEEIPEDYETPDEDADDAYTFVSDESEPVDEE